MFKQPAENTNASVADLRKVRERQQPLDSGISREEIEEVARELWHARGGQGGSAEDDWYRAEQIVRSRRAATMGAIAEPGNRSPQDESYLAGTGVSRTERHGKWKEKTLMDNSMTGTMENTGTMSGMMNKVSDRANEVVNRASEMMEKEPQSFPRPEHREGPIARTIEQQTARIPSDAWLWAAVGSMGLSLALELSGKEKTANFVGHWVPTLLIFGLYNKLVKLQGSDGV